MVDIGPAGTAYNGDEVVLIGRQGDAAIDCEAVAQAAGTIPYEILTGLNERIPREYVGVRERHRRTGALAMRWSPACRIALVWFRHDLRLDDNPALHAALDAGYTPVPVYVHAPEEEGELGAGRRFAGLAAPFAAGAGRGPARTRLAPAAASRARAAQALSALAAGNRRRTPCSGTASTSRPPSRATPRLKRQCARTGPAWRKASMARCCSSPGTLATQQGGPYKVFTPFWRNAPAQPAPARAVDRAGAHCRPCRRTSPSVDARCPGLAPRPGLGQRVLGELAAGRGGRAAKRWRSSSMARCVATAASATVPDRIGTSLLSPHLHFGEIAPWRIVARTAEGAQRRQCRRHRTPTSANWAGASSPTTCCTISRTRTTQNLNPRFARFRMGAADAAQLQAWRHGRTGVPIVDAGMRELWAHRLHAQPRAHDRRQLADQAPAPALAARRALVLGHAGRCRPGQQHAGLAVGRRHRRRCRAVLPRLQSGDPGARSSIPTAATSRRWVPELAALAGAARFAPWLHPRLPARWRPAIRARRWWTWPQGRDAALAAYASAARPVRIALTPFAAACFTRRTGEESTHGNDEGAAQAAPRADVAGRHRLAAHGAATNLMMITGVMMFDEPMTLEQLKQVDQEALPRLSALPPEGVDTPAGASWVGRRRFRPRLARAPVPRCPGARQASEKRRWSASSASWPPRRSTRPSRSGNSTWSRSTAAARRWSRASTTATPTAWRWCR